jgi:ADP-ribose pyrophosphatase YjhB (NUDIX family)
MMKPTFTIGSFAIIPDETGRVLLCHRRDRDAWNLPGGVVEHGESPWDAVTREVQEETGVHATVTRLLGVYSKPDKDEIVFSFLCRATGGRITPSDEADCIQSFHVEQLPNSLFEKQRQRIQDWIDSDAELHMREQRDMDGRQQANWRLSQARA